MTKAEQKRAQKMLRAMQQVGRVATILLDGEEAQEIVADRSFHYMANPHPTFLHLAGDYFDVNCALFLRYKKQLFRLALLLPFPTGTTLWLPVKGLEGHVTAALHNGSFHRFWSFGQQSRPAEGPLADVLRSGEQLAIDADAQHQLLTLLAPLYDSLGVVVALVEISAMHPAAKQLAPAWS